MAGQSGGKIRAIGTTEAGKFLAAIESDDYAEFREFINFPIAPDGSDPFWSKLSRFFVENTDHPLITITPRGLASSVYGTTEVKTIAANNEIELINGVARSDIGFDLFSSSDAARKAYLSAIFNGEFSGDLIASNTVTIWQVGPEENATFYFDLDEATKAALGLAGIDFAPVPVGATLAVNQQEIRDDVLPAFARGLNVALFGSLLNREEGEFLNFVGSDIDTAIGPLRTAPEPSDEFKKLQDKLVGLVKAIWALDPNADVSSLLAIAKVAVAEGDAGDQLETYFRLLAVQVKDRLGDAPEELKRDLAEAIGQVIKASEDGLAEVPGDLQQRLAITSGGQMLFLLEQAREGIVKDTSALESLIEGVGIYARSSTQLSEALYLNLDGAPRPRIRHR